MKPHNTAPLTPYPWVLALFFSAIATAQLAVLWFEWYRILPATFILLTALLLCAQPMRHVRFDSQLSVLGVFITLYAYMVVSTAWAPNAQEAVVDVGRVLVAIVPPFLFGQTVGRRFSLASISFGLGLIPLPFAFQALYSAYAYGDSMLVGALSIRTILSGLCCLIAPIQLALYISTGKRIALIQLALLLVLALLIQSRSALLIVFPAVLAAAYFLSRRMFATSLITIFVVGAAALIVLPPSEIVERFSSANTNLDISESVLEEASKPAEGRVDFDRRLAAFVSLNLFLENPVLGGGYSSVLQVTRDQHHKDVVSHGFVPGTLGELGILGIVLILIFVRRSFRVFKRMTREQPESDTILITGYKVGFVALLAYGFFHQTLESAFFALFVGLFLGAASRKTAHTICQPTDKPIRRPMRVLHLISTLGSGGAERQLSLLAPAMLSAGLDVVVAYREGGINLARLADSGVSLYQLPARANHDPRQFLDLCTVMTRLQPDLVQTWLLQMDVMGGLAARWAGIPQVLSERSSATMYANGWKFALRAALGRHAKAIVANSQGGLDYWHAQRARGCLRLIHNGLSPLVISRPADDLGLADVPLLMVAGRLSYEKNIPVLVDALAGALRQLPAHHAVLFGEGPLREDVERRIDASGLGERFHLGGFSSELGFWLQRAQALVSVSSFEGHPNVVIEAAAAGCPMVLSDIPAHREAVAASAALFAAADNASSLASHIVATVNDRQSALERADRARAATADLAIDRAAARYLALYRELLQ